MTWLFVLSLTCVTFFNRYLFLEPKTQIQLPKFATRMLKYAAPCLRVSICLPLVFFEVGHWKRLLLQNSYFYGVIFTLLITLLTRKLLLSILLSLGFFYGLNLLFDF